MPKSKPPYPEEFWREVVELVRQGCSISDVVCSLRVVREVVA
jgi:hypothetical protein